MFFCRGTIRRRSSAALPAARWISAVLAFSLQPLAFCLLLAGGEPAFAQTPFQFPTANHALFEQGAGTNFFAPTSPERPWTTGSFGCVRTSGQQMHEGLDIRSIQHDKHGEPTDPVLATADGSVVYVNNKPGLSNYGKYVILRHIIDGVDIYSLYAHLSAVAPGVTPGKAVRAGEVIATLGRTANTGESIGRDRAHVHFELNVLVNDNFAAWFKQNHPGERNDHGAWNGQNLNGLDPLQIFLAERAERDPRQPAKKFNLLTFLQGQTELCRVLVRAPRFPYLQRYPGLVLKNPKAEQEGVAGYEVALNYNGVAFALMPRAASEIKGTAKIQLLSVNEAEQRAHPCRRLVAQRNGHWQLTEKGRQEMEMLIYQ